MGDSDPTFADERRIVSVRARIVVDDRLDIYARMLWIVLALYAQTHAQPWPPSQERLATLVGCSERRLRTAKDDLVGAGWLSTHRRGLGLTNTYTLLDGWTQA